MEEIIIDIKELEEITVEDEREVVIKEVPVYPEVKDLEITPSKETQVFKEDGINYGEVKVLGDEDLLASNIKKGVEIFGVVGAMEEMPEEVQEGIEEQEEIISTQETTIDDIKLALQNKVAGGGNVTPEYTRVDYVKFTGEQVIDTGIVCNQNTKIKVVFTREKSAQHYLFGVASSDNTASITAYFGGNWRFGDKANSKSPVTNEDMVYSGVLDSSQITITGSKSAISSVNEFETIGSLTIGTCRNSNGSIPSAQYVGKIYSFEMWNSEEQVLKFVPVIKDSVYGFLDEVSGTFFTSITDVPLEGISELEG